MILIIFSIICAVIGAQIGSVMGADLFIYAFAIIGFFGPSMYMLENIYLKVFKEKEKEKEKEKGKS